MTVGEDCNRWFVDLTNGGREDVGADRLEIYGGALIFRDIHEIITFAYAPGTWKFVEYQE